MKIPGSSMPIPLKGTLEIPPSSQPDPRAASLSSLFDQYRLGDPQAAERFASLLHPLLLAYFRRNCGTREEAEDLAQECWTRIHTGRSGFHSGMPVLPWIYGVARHTRLDIYRRRKSRQANECCLADCREFPDQKRVSFDTLIQSKEILTRLAGLPPAQRTVFLLHHFHGLSAREVSLLVGCSPEAVKQKAFRARKSIRESFQVPIKLPTLSVPELSVPQLSVPESLSHPCPTTAIG